MTNKGEILDTTKCWTQTDIPNWQESLANSQPVDFDCIVSPFSRRNCWTRERHTNSLWIWGMKIVTELGFRGLKCKFLKFTHECNAKQFMFKSVIIRTKSFFSNQHLFRWRKITNYTTMMHELVVPLWVIVDVSLSGRMIAPSPIISVPHSY